MFWIFSDIYRENLVELLEVKLTKARCSPWNFQLKLVHTESSNNLFAVLSFPTSVLFLQRFLLLYYMIACIFQFVFTALDAAICPVTSLSDGFRRIVDFQFVHLFICQDEG